MFNQKPDIKISVKQTFGIDTDMEIDAFEKKNEYVPKIDQDYKFDRDTTLAVLSGFAFNSNNSASSNTFSNNSSIPSPVFADSA